MPTSTITSKLAQPIAGVTFPSSHLITSVLNYVEQHSLPTATNHVIRSAYFALIVSTKPALQSSLRGLSPSLLVLAALMHDLGWDPTGALVSKDKRFEVDGANAARDFLRAHDPEMAEADIQLVWDAIALHTTSSIAWHKEPEVAATSYGVMADFFGPNLLGGELITPEEWRAVVKAFPHIGFAEGVRDVLCGLCKTKPQTTYDNFVSGFGEKYKVEGYTLEGNRIVDQVEAGLEGLKKFELEE